MAEGVVVCPRCSQQNPVGAKFCPECGNPLAPTARAGREERKVVSVLFADLVGFTARAERLDPEEVRAILAPYHALLRRELERHGGTVEKFIGDAVVALFGAPIAHEDDAERAVRAALAIRDALGSEGELHARIGITTGEALVALEARPDSGEGMAAGDVVNTAARLQAAAPVDGILVDEATYRATARLVDYTDHAAIELKGKREPVRVFQATSARGRFGVDVRQMGHAALVGRTRERELLIGAFERAASERQPQLVTLVGVPGIGKSRLVWELFQHIDARPQIVRWRQGRSLPYAASVTYWALGEIVKAEAGILETDSTDETVAKLARAVRAVIADDHDADWVERHLRLLVGAERGGELRGDHRGEAFAAWRQLLESLADERPLVLVFEDLHWADDGLLDFLDYLVDWASDLPLLIVATSRPELLTRRPAWGGGKPNAATFSLAPLSEAETRTLVAALVERAVMPVSVHQDVLDRAQGNPLYAEEFARLLADRGRLDALPESVQGIIAARLDALSRDEKELLQDAAVVGKVFWSGALAAMGRLERRSIEDLLHALERKEFVRRDRRSSVAGETEYAFRHLLVRDVAYGQIPRGERSERHVRVAEWMEDLGRTADHAELLAHHYVAALELASVTGQPIDDYSVRARRALVEAGDRAVGLNAFASAARYFRSALELIPAADSIRPSVLFRYGKSLRVSEEKGAEILAEAEAGLRETGDMETAAEAAVLQAELAWFGGDGEATAVHLARAAGLVDALPPSYSKAYVLSDLSRYQMLRGENEQAIATGRQALDIAEALGLEEVRAHALNNVGTTRIALGDRRGLADLEEAVAIALRVRSPEAARALNNLGSVYWTLGDPRRGRETLRRALTVAVELGNVSVERFARAAMPWLDYQAGNWDDAIQALDAYVAEAEASGGHAQDSINLDCRSRIRAARGDLDGAFADAAAAVSAGRRLGDPQSLVPALSSMISLLADTQRIDEAATLLDELLAVPLAQDFISFDAMLAAHALGRQADLQALVERMIDSDWREIARLIAGRRYAEAADWLDNIDYRAVGARIRLEAARQLMADGTTAEAATQLDRAIDFWSGVSATRYIAEARRLAASPVA